MEEDGSLLFFFPLFSLVLVLPGNIQTREKAVSAPGTWPARDVWTRLWEDWYVLEIAETLLSVRSLSKRRRGRAAWPRRAARARGAASEPAPQTAKRMLGPRDFKPER